MIAIWLVINRVLKTFEFPGVVYVNTYTPTSLFLSSLIVSVSHVREVYAF